MDREVQGDQPLKFSSFEIFEDFAESTTPPTERWRPPVDLGHAEVSKAADKSYDRLYHAKNAVKRRAQGKAWREANRKKLKKSDAEKKKQAEYRAWLSEVRVVTCLRVSCNETPGRYKNGLFKELCEKHAAAVRRRKAK